MYLLFPSPYGVSFILIMVMELLEGKKYVESFPSPYGVSFILIKMTNVADECFDKKTVSVSLRSIIHSYLFNLVNLLNVISIKKFPSPYGVSFILIRKWISFRLDSETIGFRLLTEYHSFLFIISSFVIYSNAFAPVSVSLRSIIHSYKKQETG